MRPRSTLRTLGWLVILVALATVVSAGETAMYGRQVVPADTTGAVITEGGRDLLYDAIGTRYLWPTTAGTITAASSSTADTGWVVIQGLDSTWTEQIDSVRIAGAAATTTTKWIRVNGVEFRDDAANAGRIYVYSATATFAEIAPRQNRSYQGVFSVPVGRTQVVPLAWRVTAAPAVVDSLGTGAVAILGRRYGGNWKVMDQITVRAGDGTETIIYLPEGRVTWDLGAKSDYRVAASVTSSAIDFTSRFDYGIR